MQFACNSTRRPAADAVVCFRSAAFGAHAWPLPLLRGPHPCPEEAAAIFAAALLAGDVLPGMAGADLCGSVHHSSRYAHTVSS